jgi:hypothetical protein
MATRAYENLKDAQIRTFTVVSGGSATLGYAVKQDTTETQITVVAAIADNAIGIALETAVALATCRVALWGPGIAKVAVGTAGITFGCPLKYAADGLVDATVGTGTNKLVVCGQALQTGTVGQLVGANLSGFSFTVGS